MTTVSLDQLDQIVQQKLRTIMGNKNAPARMEDVFITYHTLLARNGLAWRIKDNHKVEVQHVLSEIRPQALFDRRTADLAFAKYDLRKDLKGFMNHATKLSEAFHNRLRTKKTATVAHLTRLVMAAVVAVKVAGVEVAL